MSTATVSRTIDRVPIIDPELAQQVLDIIAELGYYDPTHRIEPWRWNAAGYSESCFAGPQSLPS